MGKEPLPAILKKRYAPSTKSNLFRKIQEGIYKQLKILNLMKPLPKPRILTVHPQDLQKKVVTVLPKKRMRKILKKNKAMTKLVQKKKSIKRVSNIKEVTSSLKKKKILKGIKRILKLKNKTKRRNSKLSRLTSKLSKSKRLKKITRRR